MVGERIEEGFAALTLASEALGGIEAIFVPEAVAFGFHPYMRLPGSPRSRWELSAPVRERLELDEQMLPTGRREPVEIEERSAGRAHLRRRLRRAGKERTLRSRRRRPAAGAADGEGYPFAQIYAPPDLDAVAFEPMTAPTNALVSGEGLRMLPPGESFTATFSIRGQRSGLISRHRRRGSGRSGARCAADVRGRGPKA